MISQIQSVKKYHIMVFFSFLLLSGFSAYSNNVNVKDFGAKGNGVADDSQSIQNAINNGVLKKKPVFFPVGTYIITQQIHLKNIPLYGVYNKTTFLIKDSVHLKEKISGRSYSIFLNNNFQGAINQYANQINLSCINFEYNAKILPSQINILGLANVNSGKIDSCNFKVDDGCSAYVTAIDLWACVSNFNIESCNITILNQQKAGGCIWISDISTNGGDHRNDTYNINVDNCQLKTASKDEAFAVFGVRGTSRNINVSNCSFTALPSSQRHSVLVSIFPLNDNSTYGANAAIKLVKVSNCNFNDDYFSSHVLRIGQDADKNQVCDSIFVSNNTFYVSKASNELSFVARNIKCIGNTVVFEHNSLKMNNNSRPITYAISGFDETSNNNVQGSYSTIISNSSRADGNTMTNATGKTFSGIKRLGRNKTQ